MLRTLINRLQGWILTHPRSVLAAAGFAVVAAAWLASGVEFRTSRRELAPPDDPDQRRLERLQAEFRGTEALIAGIEHEPGSTGPEPELRAFADLLAAAFAADPAVESVFHRVDGTWLLRQLPYLVPPEALERTLAGFGGATTGTGASGLGGLGDLNRLLAGRIEGGRAGGARVPGDEARQGLEGLAALLALERRLLEHPRELAADLRARGVGALLAGTPWAQDTYLATADGTMLFLVVSPRSEDDSLPVLRAMVGSLRERADRVLAGHPGFRVGFTGPPAMTVEEMNAVRHDTWFTSLVAVLGVASLTLLVFRWKSHAFLVLAALGAGVIWALGAVRLELGYLNMLTSSFLSTLIGVGVAYGIHPLSEYELEGAHTGDPLEAIRRAYHRTGPAVTVAAVTTAAAFLSILLMRFRGFAELGLVAGVGVLLCLLSAMVLLPALVARYGHWRGRRDKTVREGRDAAALDRLWVERAADHVCRFPKTTAATALLATVAAAWLASGVRFNSNILDLLPADAESLRYLQRMTEGSDLSPVFNMVVAGDLDTLRRMQERAAAEPAIARFDSILRLLPADPERSVRAARALGERLDGVVWPAAPEPIDRERLVRSLARVARALDDAAEAAFTAGLGDFLEPLERAREHAERAAQVARAAPDGAEAAWSEAQAALLDVVRDALETVRDGIAAGPPTAETLPEPLRQRFLTHDGRYVGFLYAGGNVFDPRELAPYIEATRRVSPETTGWPLMFSLMSERITSGFYRAVALGAVLVLLILLIDLRNLRDTALAVVPLVMGMIWMTAAMRLLGLDFNFANLVGVPLILGVGIDNGVHVVHRVRFEGREGMHVVLRHTGRAILISSLTTMIGFGSLSLAHHAGLASLGLVLLLGVGSCLVTSTVVLPNLLVTLGIADR